MTLVNLTPHPVSIITSGGELTIPPSGQVARVSEAHTHLDFVEVEGVRVPIGQISYSSVEGLPEPDGETLYIVSRPVAERVAGRRIDVVVPYPLVRDEQGQVVGAGGLAYIGGKEERRLKC
jgi:hypothetical protein